MPAGIHWVKSALSCSWILLSFSTICSLSLFQWIYCSWRDHTPDFLAFTSRPASINSDWHTLCGFLSTNWYKHINDRCNFALPIPTQSSFSVAPQVAAPLAGDCTFEVDECGWTSGQGARGRDRIEWQRVPVRTQNIRYQRRPSINAQISSNENGNLMFQSNIHCTVSSLKPALYRLHSTFFSLQPALYSLHCTVCSLQPALCNLHSTVCTLQSAVYNLHSTGCTP